METHYNLAFFKIVANNAGSETVILPEACGDANHGREAPHRK